MPPPADSRDVWRWFYRRAEEDEERSGIIFTDILFGLVLAEIFTQSPELDDMPVAGIMHLVVALVLVTTSWIGYHNSKKRSSYTAKFFNLPLGLFALDMVMVFLYFLVAVTPDVPSGSDSSFAPSATEAYWVMLVFLLYVLWDGAHARMVTRRNGPDRLYPKATHRPRRMQVTRWSFVATITVAVVVFITDPSTSSSVVIVDSILIAILVLYRWAKDGVQTVRG